MRKLYLSKLKFHSRINDLKTVRSLKTVKQLVTCNFLISDRQTFGHNGQHLHVNDAYSVFDRNVAHLFSAR